MNNLRTRQFSILNATMIAKENIIYIRKGSYNGYSVLESSVYCSLKSNDGKNRQNWREQLKRISQQFLSSNTSPFKKLITTNTLF